MSITLLLVLVTAAISIYALTTPKVMDRLIFWPPAITRNHQYERFITHGFIHADGQHLLFNMITLYFFGRAIEGVYATLIGPLGFMLFYLGGIVVAILPSFQQHKNDVNYRSLGASGAVSAVLFAFILFRPWSTIYVFVLPVPAIVYAVLYTAYTIYANRQRRGNINHSAHLWGAGYGIAVTLVLFPAALANFFNRLMNP
jgi:membrane associated rhomboid family serine protease